MVIFWVASLAAAAILARYWARAEGVWFTALLFASLLAVSAVMTGFWVSAIGVVLSIAREGVESELAFRWGWIVATVFALAVAQAIQARHFPRSNVFMWFALTWLVIVSMSCFADVGAGHAGLWSWRPSHLDGPALGVVWWAPLDWSVAALGELASKRGGGRPRLRHGGAAAGHAVAGGHGGARAHRIAP